MSTPEPMQRVRDLCALAALLPLAVATAQSPVTDTLLVDLDIGPPGFLRSSRPVLVAAAPGRAWFRAGDSLDGREFWTTDGTAHGTVQLGDLVEGPDNLSDDVSALVLPNGIFLAVADSTAHGRELFVSDPTGTPLRLLHDFQPGAASSDISSLVPWQGEAWFTVTTPAHGTELWRTDGTVAGTRLADELVPGPGSIAFRPGSLLGIGTKLFFVAGSPAQLYVKDGPASAPVVVSPAGLDIGSDGPWYMGGIAGKLLFPARGTTGGLEPWISDGTPAGTMLLADLSGDATSSLSQLIASDGQRAWIVATEASRGFELWTTDGTTAGTRLVTDLAPGPASGVQPTTRSLLLPGGELLFVGDDGGGAGLELWRSDGTAAGTRLVADLSLGAASSNPRSLSFVQGEVWFTASTAGEGDELFRYDPATDRVTIHVDLVPGPESSDAAALLDLGGGAILVSAWTPTHGTELRTTTSALPGTITLLRDIDQDGNGSSDPDDAFAHRGRLWFVADLPATGREPWITDGTPAGTVSLGDLNPGPLGSVPRGIGGVGDRLLFGTFLNGSVDLWASDGTATGTQRLRTLATTTSGSVQRGLLLADDLLLFVLRDGARSRLWRTDGTAAGTMEIPLAASAEPLELEIAVDGRAFARIRSRFGDRELLTTDGTQVGTLHWDLFPGTLGSRPSAFAAVPGGAVFVATDSRFHRELWFAGGTPLGVRMIAELEPGPVGVELLGVASAGRFAIAKVRGQQSLEDMMWRTDGTTAGTVRIDQALPAGVVSTAEYLTAAGDQVFFWCRPTGSTEHQLWITDGTSGGFRPVRTTGLGPGASPLYAIGDGTHVAFTRADPTFGTELWISDGTAAGTRVLTDSAPGRLSAFPGAVTRLGNHVLFTADDRSTGVEWHTVDLGATGAWVASRYGTGCGIDLQVLGSPTLGDPFTLTVETATANAPTQLLFSPVPAWDRLASGCLLHLVQPDTVAALLADGTGDASVSFTVPNVPALLGDLLHFQAFAMVPGGPLFGTVAGTPGLEVVVGR